MANSSRAGHPDTLLSDCVRGCVNYVRVCIAFILKHDLPRFYLASSSPLVSLPQAISWSTPFQDKHSSSLFHLSSLRDFAGRRSMSSSLRGRSKAVMSRKRRDESAEN